MRVVFLVRILEFSVHRALLGDPRNHTCDCGAAQHGLLWKENVRMGREDRLIDWSQFSEGLMEAS